MEMDYVGPDVPNLSDSAPRSVGDCSPSGRCVAIAGDSAALYVLSNGGGVWKSVNGGPWSLLENSPATDVADLDARFKLATSARDEQHVVVGTPTGLFESVDGGDSWSLGLDPKSTLGTRTSRILAVAFDDDDRLFVGVDDGIAVRATAGDAFTHESVKATVTAIAVTDTKVWARTAQTLILSTDHGGSWSAIPIKAGVSFRAKEQAALAATDDYAFLVATGSPGTEGCAANNLLVIFDLSYDMGQGPDAVAWLAGDFTGSGRAQIAQPFDNNGRLGLLVYGADASGQLAVVAASGDMGQGPDAVAWLAGDFTGSGRTQIAQPFDNA